MIFNKLSRSGWKKPSAKSSVSRDPCAQNPAESGSPGGPDFGGAACAEFAPREVEQPKSAALRGVFSRVPGRAQFYIVGVDADGEGGQLCWSFGYLLFR